MTRRFKVSFEIETLDDGFQPYFDSPSASTVVAYNHDKSFAVRVPNDAEIKEVIRDGYWRYKASSQVFKLDGDKTPGLRRTVESAPDEWEPVKVEVDYR